MYQYCETFSTHYSAPVVTVSPVPEEDEEIVYAVAEAEHTLIEPPFLDATSICSYFTTQSHTSREVVKVCLTSYHLILYN